MGDLVVRKGKEIRVSDVDRPKERINIAGHWISYRNVELPGKEAPGGAKATLSGHLSAMKHWEWKDGVLRLKVRHLVKYGFPTTAILHTVEASGKEGFLGTNKELHERLPFLPPEYIRNLVPKMVKQGLLLRDTVKHGLFHLKLTDNV